MHVNKLENWQHKHEFSVRNERGERRTQYVLILTAITMVVEIIAGSIFSSMALLADGWHMSTHVAAFMITIFAYRFARKHADNKITDIHVWKVGPNHYAAIISIVTQFPKVTEYYKELLSEFHKLSHITVEINKCNEESCLTDNAEIS